MPGARVFRFRIAPRPGELVTQNNAREALIDVADRREQILYYEGEPRAEMAFLNRAVHDDKNLSVVTLQRTADNKFQRFLEVDNPDQLVAGFPKTREELFAYRGLMLGSVEAGAFTGDQLRMISEFVERRGGGLLVLGGPRSFAEGGYAGTPVADALPVTLERLARVPEPLPVTRLHVKPTRAGEAHGVTQIAPTEAASLARWKDLPVLTSVNAITAVKPGATVLLNGTDGRKEQVVLAWQRYGRGKALAFPVQDSWHWQMDVKMSLEDQTHENYWRQLLRWVVDGVPSPVDVHTLTDRVEPGEPVTFTADVVDGTFVEVNDARVIAKVTGPKGDVTDVPMQWTGERNGQYRATFPTSELGHVLGAGRRLTRRQDAWHGQDRHPRRTERCGVLRRDDARAAAAADCGRYRRPFLHAGDDRRNAGRLALHRPRRHDHRRTRALAHADRADAVPRAAVRGVGLPSCRRPRINGDTHL